MQCENNSATLHLKAPVSYDCAVPRTSNASEMDEGRSLLSLPESVLLHICTSSVLDVNDRVNLMLTCKLLSCTVRKCWSLITKLRITNNESDDDRISDTFVALSIHKSASSLTSITLCLSSSINAQLCRGVKLFMRLRACVHLEELTLLLTQLSLRVLNSGLSMLSQIQLRKLALVNSVADVSTMRVLVNTQSESLRSLGFINCFHLNDVAFDNDSLRSMKIYTLNIRSSRHVGTSSVQRVINAHRRLPDAPPLKLYIFRSNVDRMLLRYEQGRVLFSDEGKCWRKRMHSGKFLSENAVRPEWEYNSDEDDFVAFAPSNTF